MPPYLLLIILLGGLYGVLFYLWRGKGMQDLVIYFLTGVIGFGLGQGLGNLSGLNTFLIGPLHLVEATLVSWLSLFIMRWLKVG